MAKRCNECRHWKQSSAFKNYDGGYPGRCLAPFPLSLTLVYGTKSTDRFVSSNQDARECASFSGSCDFQADDSHCPCRADVYQLEQELAKQRRMEVESAALKNENEQLRRLVNPEAHE